MSLADWKSSRLTLRFPRVSGDEPSALGNLGNTLWFSPRERG